MSLLNRCEMKSRKKRILTRVVATTVNYATAHGLSMAQITQATGITRTDLIDQDSRIEEESLRALWSLIGSSHKGISKGIHMANALSPSVLGPVEYLVRYAGSLEMAMDALVRYGRVLADRIQFTRVDGSSSCGLKMWHPLDEMDCGQPAEAGLASLFHLIHECANENIAIGVDLAHAPLGSPSAYEDFFKVPVRFEQDSNAIYFRREGLEVEMVDADSQLFQYVQSNLQLMEDRWLLPGERHAISCIYEAVRINAESARFSAEELAITLGVNLRKLQRIVEKEGLTVSNILRDARLSIAKRLLRDGNHNVEDIAAAAGYSDSRAFRRAFKRWTGQSPTEYRTAHRE